MIIIKQECDNCGLTFDGVESNLMMLCPKCGAGNIVEADDDE